MPFPRFTTKTSANGVSINLTDLNADFVDTDKIGACRGDILRDLRNYILFQRKPSFRWPLWLTALADPQSEFHRPIVPVFLTNTAGTDSIAFSNFLSAESLLVDMAGMLSPSYGSWSIESWLIADGVLHRPQSRPGRVSVERSPLRGTVKATWDETGFRTTIDLFGIRTDIDEAVAEFSCTVKKAIDSAVLCVAIRPYNGTTLGGIDAVEYAGDSRIVRINGRERIVMGAKPDYVWAGGFETGDIDALCEGGGDAKARCRYGMATIGLFYRLKRGENALALRISLARDRSIRAAKLDIKKLRDDYSAFAEQRTKAGATVAVADRQFQNWFNAAKMSLLSNLNDRSFYPGATIPDVHQARLLFYSLAAYVRMGAYAESLTLLEAFQESLALSEQPSFNDIIVASYYLCAAADYFSVSRNIDHLKSVFARVKIIADEVLAHSSRIKEKHLKSAAPNTVPYHFILHAHLHDVCLLSCACRQFSYLARCMGIFGDELKFAKEAQRLEEIILKEIAIAFPAPRTGKKGDGEGRRPTPSDEDETLLYYLFAGFPFALSLLSPEKRKTMTEGVIERYQGAPLYCRSLGGWDTFLSLVLGVNLISVRDTRAYDIISLLADIGGKRYAVPAVVNPRSRHGVFGAGDSRLALSVLFLALRDLLFIDSDNRLELFPVPREDWFAPGSEIAIREAPSRFGMINLRMVSTPNEIQLHFEQLPQYLPHDMLINLPMKTTLVKEDDFIIKKEIGTSFLISGWPTIVRFLRQ